MLPPPIHSLLRCSTDHPQLRVASSGRGAVLLQGRSLTQWGGRPGTADHRQPRSRLFSWSRAFPAPVADEAPSKCPAALVQRPSLRSRFHCAQWGFLPCNRSQHPHNHLFYSCFLSGELKKASSPWGSLAGHPSGSGQNCLLPDWLVLRIFLTCSRRSLESNCVCVLSPRQPLMTAEVWGRE